MSRQASQIQVGADFYKVLNLEMRDTKIYFFPPKNLLEFCCRTNSEVEISITVVEETKMS